MIIVVMVLVLLQIVFELRVLWNWEIMSGRVVLRMFLQIPVPAS